MKTIALSIFSACTCLAAIGNLRVLGTTSTQALLAYDAPDANACTIQLSQSAGLTPLALDVDPGTFANSNLDLSRAGTVTAGLSRTIVLGQRTAQFATAGAYSGIRHYSRALQALTPYFGQITCPSTGDTAAFSFTTGNIPLGQTYGDPWLSDPTNPGNQPWPESLGGLTPDSFIDPLTGTLQFRVGVRGNVPDIWNLAFGSAFNQGQVTPCDSAGPWTSPCNVTAGSGNTTVGNSTAPLILRPPMVTHSPWLAGYGAHPFSMDQFGLSLTGLVNSATMAKRVLDICLSLNGGGSCASAILQMLMGQTSSLQTIGAAPTGSFGTLTFGTTPWELDTVPRLNANETAVHSGGPNPTVGGVNVSGSTVTWVSGDPFSLYWLGGGHIRLSTINDACTTPPASTTSTEWLITGMPDGNTITVSGSPPTGSNLYWCADNFALMVWRDAPDSSTVTLTAAVLNAQGSYFPGYPDNGGSTACDNIAYDGGYWCMYGGLYWVNPTGPSVAFYGNPQGPGKDGSGTPITNSWNNVSAPIQETSGISQTGANLTFDMIGSDPGGAGPLVIQGVFNPGSTPTQPSTPVSGIGTAQIQNATVASTTAYSVTWNNGMTFTNLTPQSSMSESLFQQAAAFDSTFSAASIAGANCGRTGAVTQGIFFLACYYDNGDTPAWAFAFTPGDGNPAHAGASGGPKLIGLINTFNTPNPAYFSGWPVPSTQGTLVGRSLHALGETGETGWVNITANDFEPINTSATSIPAPGSRVACSTFTGLGSLSGNCFLVQINSYTYNSVTGYEPYFKAPPPSTYAGHFLGTPGELRTAQIGDTACFTTTAATGCSWDNKAQEIGTLEIKNYASVPGAWVFQGQAYGAQMAVTGPIALWWESFDHVIPVASIAPPSGQVYWNPVAGCGGSPDPHGNCLIENNNETGAHGENRNGTVSQTTSVPNWGQPIWGWPFDYQNSIGYVPGVLGLANANSTPGAVSGVNYVAAEPPFDGVFGHPWGFDGGNHPNPPGVNASSYESIRAFDNIPVQGGQNEPTYTLVTGQLYKATPTSNVDTDDPFGYTGSGADCPSGCVAINRKLMATGASCGAHPLIDVSGPSASIATDATGSYTYGVVRTAGELRSGSTVGQVYVNCPGVAFFTAGAAYCNGVATHGGNPLGAGNDICVGNIGNAADAIIQYSLDQPSDYYGTSRRALVSATSWLRMVYGFENNALLPDNSWLLYRQEWLNYQRPEMWMAKMLPYPPRDSVNRGTFVPIPITLSPPAGLDVNNAVIEFGYQEYGAPQIINCTTRNDACVATAATVPPGNQPFYFASESPAGASCASGCTITIPAISQRVLYYQVQYRTAGSAVIATGAPTLIMVP